MEAIRAFLKTHGIEEGPNESLVSTMARAAGIDSSEVTDLFGRRLLCASGDR